MRRPDLRPVGINVTTLWRSGTIRAHGQAPSLWTTLSTARLPREQARVGERSDLDLRPVGINVTTLWRSGTIRAHGQAPSLWTTLSTARLPREQARVGER